MTTISKNELTANSYSVEDNSPRGISVKYKEEIQVGDMVVINNQFVMVK